MTAIAPFVLVLALLGTDLGDWMATRVSSPQYPILALQARISGEVHLKVRVDALGVVGDVKVIRGNPVLAAEAKENLTNWTFARMSKAATGPDLGAELEFVYDFRIRDEPSQNPNTQFVFQHPSRVSVTASAPHWMP